VFMNIVSPMADAPFYAESNASGVSWAAVIGGAFVTAAFALVLIILGVGFGLSWISPWSGAGASSKAIGAAAIVWLIATQAIASGLGGYLVGRLRRRWPTVHTHEVYFRDTAHGILVWAVAVVITAAFLGSAVSLIVGSRTKLAATTAAVGAIAATPVGGETVPGAAGNPRAEAAPAFGPQSALATAGGYLTDLLLRGDRNPADAGPARLELGRILAEGLRKGTLPEADRTYAAQVIAARTGLSQADAEKRVDAVYAQGKSIAAEAELAARRAADAARKNAAQASLWMFVALLTGAFCASLAATIGGRQRDCVACCVVDTDVRNS
jgi:hypothetical protein